jgi:hypothetical protein
MAIRKKRSRTSAQKRVSAPVREVVGTGPIEGTGGEVITIRLVRSRLMWLGLGVLVILAGLVYLARGWLVAALVNGQPVWRYELVGRLEEQTGAETLDGIITERLIVQEAAKKGVQVSEAEIDTQVEDLRGRLTSQGQDLDQALEVQGVTMVELRERIRLEKLAEALVGEVEAPSEEAVEAYLTDNAEVLPEGVSQEELKTMAREQLDNQTRQQKVQGLLEELRNGARINYWVAL